MIEHLLLACFAILALYGIMRAAIDTHHAMQRRRIARRLHRVFGAHGCREEMK